MLSCLPVRSISGALGTAAAANGLIPATIGLITGPVGFLLDADSFALTLASTNIDRFGVSHTQD